MIDYKAEQLHDKYCPPSRSLINIEKMDTDLGLDEYCLTSLFADFIFCEYVDINDGLDFKDGFYVCSSKTDRWRKARVLLISNTIKDRCEEKVGDIIIFPSTRGLDAGKVTYKDPISGEIKITEHGFFINEERIFGKVIENKK